MTTLATVQKVLAYQGLAAAQAAAAGSTDPDVIALIAHYKAAGCNPSNLGPMPASILASQPGAYWIYEPSGRDQCAFSSWDPSAGAPPTPIATPAPVLQSILAATPVVVPPVSTTQPGQTIVAATPSAPPPPVPIAPGQPVVASTPSTIAWLTEPSALIPTIPNYWIVGGAALLAFLLFSRRR